MKIIDTFVKEVIKLSLDMELELGNVGYFGDTDCMIMPDSNDIYEHIMGYDIIQDIEQKLGVDLYDYDWTPIERKIKQAIAKNMDKYEKMVSDVVGIYH